MAVQTYSAAVDTIFSTTMPLIRRRVADAVFKTIPFLLFMLARGRVDFEGGGLDIRETIRYRKNPTVLDYEYYDTLNLTPSEELTEAIYQWRLKAGTMSISGHEAEVKNAGRARLISMIAEKLSNLESTMRESVAEDLVRMPASKSSKEILGISNFIEDGSYGVVGGINGNTNTWWRNQWAGGKVINNLIDEYRSMYNNCTKGGKRPDLILVPQTQYEKYEKLIVNPGGGDGMYRIQDRMLADAGIEHLRYKGAFMMWDELLEDATLRPGTHDTKTAFFINTASMGMTVHKSRNFKPTPFQKPIDQDAKVSQLLFAGNLTANNRRNLGGVQFTS